MALGGSALTLNETLGEFFGKPELDPEPNRRGLRVMVNQLRNAFAYSPRCPTWVIRPTLRMRHPTGVNGQVIASFNAESLNSAGVKPEDVGGLETWVKVLQYCESIVPD